MFTLRVMTSILVSFAFLTGATAIRAQDKFPSRTIRIIVPFAPGGGVDTLARLLAERMQAKMGVNVIVENRAGASGTVGGSHVLQSQPDGYTRAVLVEYTHHVEAGDEQRAVRSARRLHADRTRRRSATARRDLAEAAAEDARGGGGRRSEGAGQVDRRHVPSLGSPGHVATLSFNRLTKTNMTITPYRGTAPALTDVAGGHTQMLIDAMVVLLPMAKSGGVKALAVTTAKRSAIGAGYPDCGGERRPGTECRLLVWHVGSQGHARPMW